MSDNWKTPQWVLDPIREFYDGKIDLDPFHDPKSLVSPEHGYTKEDNGYKQPWYGSVFANPPYSKPNLQLATEKAVSEDFRGKLNVRQILLLIPAYTSTSWFQKNVFQHAHAILYYNKRISFLDENNKPTGSPTFHSVLVYYGPHSNTFINKFRQYGHVETLYPSRVFTINSPSELLKIHPVGSYSK